MNMEINPSEYKILIVDDVMSNVLLLKVLLTNEKFAIATASNGRQALEQVDKENPDLVLLDVMMPDKPDCKSHQGPQYDRGTQHHDSQTQKEDCLSDVRCLPQHR